MAKRRSKATRTLMEFQANLQQQKHAIEQLLEGLQTLTALQGASSPWPARIPHASDNGGEPAEPVATGTVDRMKGTDLVVKILNDAQRPLSMKEVLEHAIAAGWTTRSKDPIKVVAQNLYWLRETKRVKSFGKPPYTTWGSRKMQAAVTVANALKA
jgi:hypothetical protein